MTHLFTKRPDKHIIPSENLPNCEKHDPSMKEFVWVWSAHLGGYVGYVREDVYIAFLFSSFKRGNMPWDETLISRPGVK